jgi:hypothetical protein
MFTTVQKTIGFETKEPKEVFAWVIQFLRANSKNLNSIKVKLNLLSSKQEVLLYLSQFVPADELCFKIDYKAYKKTELAEKLKSATVRCYTFECELTKFLGGDETLRFIERDIFGMKLGMLRGLSFMLIVENISLKGLPEDGTAFLDLMDYKAWRRKERFGCSINLSFRAIGMRDQVTKEILRAVSAQTGVDFTKSKIIESFPSNVTIQPDMQQMLAMHICFNEVIAEASKDMKNIIPDWTLVPGLKRRFDSVINDRIRNITEGKTGKVNFNSIAKKFYKTELNNFTFYNNDGEVLWFSKPLSETVKIMAGIEKIHAWGLGKTFTLQVGLHVRRSEDTKPQFLHTPFNRLLHERNELCWTYATEDELLDVLQISSQVLKKILVRWEERITKYFASVPNNIPDFLTRRDGLTMRAVYHEAHAIAKEISSDSELTGVYSGCYLEIRELDGGAGVDEKGKLKLHGNWGFFYQSDIIDLRFGVIVPAIGSSYYVALGTIRQYRKPVIANLSDLLDSDKAMVVMQEQLVNSTKQNNISVWDALMRLEVDGPPETWFAENRNKYVEGTPIWSVGFLGSSERGRQDVSVAFDAATGKKVVCSIY